jgi:L-glutamine:2-deoxy-scyllo-inosose/3-amino-2,3-dideoxy-scyllo-inosose aminotransferase
MANLALLGGGKVAAEKICPTSWPPRSEKTAEALKQVYLSGQWSFNSAEEQAFEKEFAAYTGAKHAILMVNGTVTLEAALAALSVGPGDEVVVPALTWMATAMAVHYVGAIPVFVDIEASTLCLDPAKFAKAITPRTKAVIPVHLYGSMANLDQIMEIAKAHKIAVIEDCAHMQGGFWNGKGAGASGAIGSYSFQQSKTLSSGEGGICLTNDDELADRLYRYKHIGYGRGAVQGGAKVGPPEGLCCHNYRSTAFQAVILRHQLQDLPALIKTYERNVAILKEALKGVAGVRIQSPGAKATQQGYYGVVFVFDQAPMKDIPLTTLIAALNAEGLECGGTYGPVYKHALYNARPDTYRIDGGSCPVAENAGTANAVSIIHYTLSNNEAKIRQIAEIVEKVCGNVEELKGV